MFKGFTDFNTNNTIQNRHTLHLSKIEKSLINDYADKNKFTIGTLATNTHSHPDDGSSQFYIQELSQDVIYNKIFVFGKYQTATATNHIDLVYSNNLVQGSSPNYTPPSDRIFGESIRGKIRHDGFYHFTHIIDAIPNYVSFFNPNTESLTNLEIHYVKLQ
jgi:hypothetical protein